jgi:hypothetical protein
MDYVGLNFNIISKNLSIYTYFSYLFIYIYLFINVVFLLSFLINENNGQINVQFFIDCFVYHCCFFSIEFQFIKYDNQIAIYQIKLEILFDFLICVIDIFLLRIERE